jgi:hypothetical protein
MMNRFKRVALGGQLCLGLVGYSASIHRQSVHASGQCTAACNKFNIDAKASAPLGAVSLPPKQGCTTRMSNGFPLPDPDCTPGAINPTLTADVLRNTGFRTCCVRDDATTAQQKAATYGWYSIQHPQNNVGQGQTCELDHLVSLELGGADTLENIWPQCGPSGVSLPERFFKQKDMVENYLAKQVKEGKMDLGDAQKGIATDWTQFLADAKRCQSGGCN